jgi:arsenate reductase-like glutaredoxin family protein
MNVEIHEIVDARKSKIAPKDALNLLKEVDTVYAARGKNVVTFDLQSDRPEDSELMEHLIGRSGSLRAPAARIGRTLVVGFNAELYRKVLKA